MTKYDIKAKNKNKIKELRELNGYTREEISKLAGINPHTYRTMERNPIQQNSIRQYMILANFYGVTLDYLLGFDPVPALDRSVIDLRMLKKLEELNLQHSKKHSPNTDTLDKSLNYELIGVNEYPVNLLNAIFGENVIKKNLKFTTKLTEELENLLIAHLTDKEIYILKQRYINKLALRPLGKLLKVTAEAIRQTEVKALNKLKNEYVMKKLTYNIDKDIEEKEKKLKTLKNEVDYYENLCRNNNIKIINTPYSTNLTLKDLRLPYRATVILTSNGIKHLKDLLLLIDNPQILEIPNFGAKTYIDTLHRLKELNYIYFNDKIKTPRKCMKTIKIIE